MAEGIEADARSARRSRPWRDDQAGHGAMTALIVAKSVLCVPTAKKGLAFGLKERFHGLPVLGHRHKWTTEEEGKRHERQA
jgi:hypothetical protein